MQQVTGQRKPLRVPAAQGGTSTEHGVVLVLHLKPHGLHLVRYNAA